MDDPPPPSPPSPPLVKLEPDVSQEEEIDWVSLRKKSLQPGGFGKERVVLWPRLLGIPLSHSENPEDDESWQTLAPHSDERQIQLDTDRSFVLYPVQDESQPNPDRDALKAELNNLLVRLFREHPSLSYFQGFHDISTVLFLTLPPSTLYTSLESLSLQRLRDSMGTTLEPVLGLVRITRNLLRVVDSEYARQLERTSPLPFYALSNLLTLFSHDMPTLELIQHVFDYLLARPPIACVYLTTAILLARKPALAQLQEDDDGGEDLGMAHSVLSTLPPIVDHIPDEAEEKKQEVEVKEEVENVPELPKQERDDEDEEDSTPPSPPSPSTSPYPPLPISLPPSPTKPPPPPPLSLTVLLTHSDNLLATYPPTCPELKIDQIMGPKSVVYTWSEEFFALPSVEECEKIVGRQEGVVLPFLEEPESGEEDEDEDELDLISEKKGRNSMRKMASGREWYLSRRRQAVVTTTVLVLGVALAVYGSRENRVVGKEEEWRRVLGWTEDFSLPTLEEAEAIVARPEDVVIPFIEEPEFGEEDEPDIISEEPQ